MKITVIGEVNHGKTTLVETLLGKPLLKSREELKDSRTRSLQVEDFKIKEGVHYILDCPGHSSYLNNSILPIPYSDLIIVLFSAVQGTVPEKMLALLQYCKYHRKKILLVITKVDLCETSEIFTKRASKITALLSVAGILDYEACIFSSTKPKLKNNLLERIEKMSKKIIVEKEVENTLVLRSFNLNNPGELSSKYKTGIIGCLPSKDLAIGEYYLNEETKTTKIVVQSIIDPSYDYKGYVTFKSNLAGCYCASNRLQGSIISKTPLDKNVPVELIVEKFFNNLIKIPRTNTYIIVGFSMYKINLPFEEKNSLKNSFKIVLPFVSSNNFLILEKVEKNYVMIAAGRISRK